MSTHAISTIWTRNKKEESCYALKWDEEDMCTKCRNFYQREDKKIGKRPRKGTKPKYSRIKLMKHDPNLGRLKLEKEKFKHILERKGCLTEDRNSDLK